MFLLSILLLVGLLALVGFGVYLLAQDRAYWRSQYQELQAESRQREKHLFDEILLAKSVRPTTAPRQLMPAREEVEKKDIVNEDDFLIAKDRIQEYAEAGHITPSTLAELTMRLESGEITNAELDRELWSYSQRLN